jgi:hypothetical protein
VRFAVRSRKAPALPLRTSVERRYAPLTVRAAEGREKKASERADDWLKGRRRPFRPFLQAK